MPALDRPGNGSTGQLLQGMAGHCTSWPVRAYGAVEANQPRGLSRQYLVRSSRENGIEDGRMESNGLRCMFSFVNAISTR